MKKQGHLKSIVAASILALGVASVAQAQPAQGQGPQAQQGQMQRSMKGGPGMGAGPMSIVSPRIIEDLNLTDAQKAQYKAIDDFQKEVMTKRKEGFTKLNDLRAKQMESGSLDLEALFAADNVERAQAMKDHQEFQTKVLDFWKTLDTDQKAKVSEAFTAKQERMSKRMQNKQGKQQGPRDGSGPRAQQPQTN